ncbi:right-handed parallel beta-helix repeat-containing protein [Nostoc sphaeroides CHAB 2801]|uniref:right-handed parallel beta-helix repeat-containing protein n=1 Tax=Nostoc sphaeroides TaxID=446679 RepID=UPI001E2FB063|nr:right-handed parallel beta-helix repeat-containing protein [Nostoc sphaeroides]MCC5632340.1 right-handed parallel beta-helix repeat-containing protein [Nostoc sphaeroides CHAB 2801]
MDRRTFLIYASLGSVVSTLNTLLTKTSSGVGQESKNKNKILLSQTLPNRFVNVYAFGKLVSGKTNQAYIIAANTKTIQKAIDTVGQQGGGTIYIPRGYYQVAPPNLTVNSPSSIVINYDNITLAGAGIGKTIIESRGYWSVINEEVVRGHGIMIQGTNNFSQPRKNVTIKNLELHGGINGFTGDREWPANPKTGDGWDVSHKGIVLDFDKYLDNITIDSVYVHDFRGEVIYGGGSGIGKLTISNTKLANSNASMLSLDANLTVTKCQFSQTANAWVENAPISPNKSYYFDECIFKDSIASGLVIAQGNFSSGRKVTITNCNFYNSPTGICPFGGASDFQITNNKFFDVSNVLFTSGVNRDIEFYQNEIYGKREPVTTASLFGELSNIVIKNNYHQGSNNAPLVGCIFYYADLKNIVIENNIFKNCRTPEQLADLTNERPLFINNEYINVQRRDRQGSYLLWWRQEIPYMVTPKCEELVLENITSSTIITIDMSISRYLDGQEVLVTGGSFKSQVKLPQNSATIQCQSDRFLRGQGEEVRLKFNKSKQKWYEVF